MVIPTRVQRGAIPLILLMSLLCLCLAAGFCIAELKHSQQKLQMRIELQRLRSSLERALTYSRLYNVKLTFKSQQNGYRLEGISKAALSFYPLPSGMNLSTRPKLISIYSARVNSPAQFDLKSESFSCRLTLSLRGRIRQKCEEF